MAQQVMSTLAIPAFHLRVPRIASHLYLLTNFLLIHLGQKQQVPAESLPHGRPEWSSFQPNLPLALTGL